MSKLHKSEPVSLWSVSDTSDVLMTVFMLIVFITFIYAIGFAAGKAEAASIPVPKNLPLQPPRVEAVAPPAEPLTAIEGYVLDICKRYPDVSPEMVHSVIWHESRYDASSKNSNGTCVGLMQISTKWHKQRAEKLGVTDLFDPYGNILVGVDYLNDLYQYNGKDWNLALMLYSMDNKKARAMYAKGEITNYVSSVIHKEYELRMKGVNSGERERGIVRSINT